MERDNSYIRQYKLVKMVVFAQTLIALIIGGLMFLAKEGLLTLPAADFGDPAQFILIRNILWGISAVLVLFYFLLQNAIYTISEEKEMAFLKFWVRQLHVHDRSSAVALLMIPASLGEATVLLSLVLFIFGGRTVGLFLPGTLVGLWELLFSFPGEKVREKVIFLDETVRLSKKA